MRSKYIVHWARCLWMQLLFCTLMCCVCCHLEVAFCLQEFPWPSCRSVGGLALHRFSCTCRETVPHTTSLTQLWVSLQVLGEEYKHYYYYQLQQSQFNPFIARCTLHVWLNLNILLTSHINETTLALTLQSSLVVFFLFAPNRLGSWNVWDCLCNRHLSTPTPPKKKRAKAVKGLNPKCQERSSGDSPFNPLPAKEFALQV